MSEKVETVNWSPSDMLKTLAEAEEGAKFWTGRLQVSATNLDSRAARLVLDLADKYPGLSHSEAIDILARANLWLGFLYALEPTPPPPQGE